MQCAKERSLIRLCHPNARIKSVLFCLLPIKSTDWLSVWKNKEGANLTVKAPQMKYSLVTPLLASDSGSAISVPFKDGRTP